MLEIVVVEVVGESATVICESVDAINFAEEHNSKHSYCTDTIHVSDVLDPGSDEHCAPAVDIDNSCGDESCGVSTDKSHSVGAWAAVALDGVVVGASSDNHS